MYGVRYLEHKSLRIELNCPLGPVVDGTFVPALPGKLLLQGAFDHGVKVMVGHNFDEVLLISTLLRT
jgi:hypothetical protein